MRHALLLFTILIAPVMLRGQAVRFDSNSYTTNSSCVGGSLCNVLAIPGATINFCSGTQSTLALCLSNPATTYTSFTAGTPCPTTAQLTAATGATACGSKSNNQGDFGAWLLPGQYSFYIRPPSSAGGGTSGPYPVNVGASAGCPLGATCDASYQTLAAACTAAGTGTLYVTRTWSALTTQTLACNIYALANGIIKPASGQTVTLTGAFDGSLTQHFDLSASGSMNLSGSKISALPVEWYGAVGDGITNNATAIQNAINANKSPLVLNCNSLYGISSGLYIPAGNIGMIWQGGCAQTGTAGSTGAGLIALSGFSGSQMLNVLTYRVTFRDILFHGNGNAAVGLVSANGALGFWDHSQIVHMTGDGGRINAYATPSTTTTQSITGGVTTSFTVANANVTGLPIGGSLCGGIILGGGVTGEEFLSASVIGNTVTASPLNNHNSGATVQCNGNNDNLEVNADIESNGGWCLNIFNGTDENGLLFDNLQMSGCVSGGLLGAGNGAHLNAWRAEGNTGPPVQLGDSAGGTAGGRTASNWTILPPSDNESNGSSNAVVEACGSANTIWYRQPSEYSPTGTCTPTGVNSTAFGHAVIPGGGQSEFSVYTGNGVSPSVTTGYLTLSPLNSIMQWWTAPGGTLLSTCGVGDSTHPCGIASQIVSKNTPNLVVICTALHTPDTSCPSSSANNALVGILRDSAGSLITLTNGLQANFLFPGYSLQAGGNTLNLNANSAANVVGGLTNSNLATLISGNGIYGMTYVSGEWLVNGVR